MSDTSKAGNPDGSSTGTADAGKTQETVSTADYDALLARVSSAEAEIKKAADARQKAKEEARAAEEEARRKAEEAAAKSGDIEALKKANEELRKSVDEQLAEERRKYSDLHSKYEREMFDGELIRRLSAISHDPEVAAGLLRAHMEMTEVDGKTIVRPRNSAQSIEAFGEKWLLENKKDYLLKSQRTGGTGTTTSDRKADAGGKYSYQQLQAMTDAEYAAAVKKDPSVAKIFAAGGRK